MSNSCPVNSCRSASQTAPSRLDGEGTAANFHNAQLLITGRFQKAHILFVGAILCTQTQIPTSDVGFVCFLSVCGSEWWGMQQQHSSHVLTSRRAPWHCGTALALSARRLDNHNNSQKYVRLFLCRIISIILIYPKFLKFYIALIDHILLLQVLYWDGVGKDNIRLMEKIFKRRERRGRRRKRNHPFLEEMSPR